MVNFFISYEAASDAIVSKLFKLEIPRKIKKQKKPFATSNLVISQFPEIYKMKT